VETLDCLDPIFDVRPYATPRVPDNAELSRAATKELGGLDDDARSRAAAGTDKLAADPRPQVVLVLKVGCRRQVYRGS